MRAVLVSTILLLALGDAVFAQTGTPAPAASVAESMAKIKESQVGADVARRPYPLAGSGQGAQVLMHGWGPTYVPKRPEEVPILAAPDPPTTGFYQWSRNVDTPRTWTLFSIQAPCWKC